MSPTTYTPEPGALDAKVIDWLAANEGEPLTAEIIEAKFGTKAAYVPGKLYRALRADLLCVEEDLTEGVLVYTLPAEPTAPAPAAKPARPAVEAPNPEPRVAQAMAEAPAVFPFGAGDTPAPEAPPARPKAVGSKKAKGPVRPGSRVAQIMDLISASGPMHSSQIAEALHLSVEVASNSLTVAVANGRLKRAGQATVEGISRPLYDVATAPEAPPAEPPTPTAPKAAPTVGAAQFGMFTDGSIHIISAGQYLVLARPDVERLRVVMEAIDTALEGVR